MKEKDIKIFEKEEIIKFVENNKNYGDTLTFDELQQFTHYNLKDEFDSYKFKSSTMSKVKNALIEKGYVMKSIKTIGYYILKQNQISSFTYRTFIKKPMKSLLKADTILGHTKIYELTSKELETHNLTYELNKKLIKANEKLLNEKQYSKLKDI